MNETIYLNKSKIPICPDCKAILIEDEYSDKGEDWECEVCDQCFYESQIEWCNFKEIRKT